MFHPAKALAVLICLAGASVLAQYPGQVTKKSENVPQLRAVAVLEWTGEAGKPKFSRIVPVTIYDGERLNDAGLYLARPQPLAVSSEVEYQLKQEGKTVGLFEIKNAGREQGSWVGYGEWKALPKPKPAPAQPVIDDQGDDDKPVLHRKHRKDETGSPESSKPAPASVPDDPDRPKLHKKTDSADANSNADPDRPTLHKGHDSDDTTAGDAPVDPDRPLLKKPKPKAAEEDVAHSDSLPQVTDPDRPRLQRGKSNADNLKVTPSLMGLPPDMQQAVAISDAQNHPDHPWTFSWTNPEDEAKFKAQLEDLAREALGLVTPAPAPKPAMRAATPAAPRSAARKAAQATPLPEPAPLQNEQFRVFELAYGAGATLVLTADTGRPLAQQRFVTLIAQPDIYGNLQVLFKNVTDGTHLDDSPRMRLVDAVDALADNRGELLFELRGETSRQFALYRVYRGRADKLFASGGAFFGELSSQ